MISQQRLLTLLLGVLFATAPTDQASALYDPGVGRFCSRDPIGYMDDRNNGSLYVMGIRLKNVDPSGMIIEITPLTPFKDRHETKKCGVPVQETYLYRFTEKSPCEGFMIQQITICCGAKKCEKGCCPSFNIDPPVGIPRKRPSEWPSDLKCETYWEKWDVKKGAYSPNSPTNYSDMFSFTFSDKKCGYMIQMAEARFYCDNQSPNNSPEHRRDGIPEPSWTNSGLRRLPWCGTFHSGTLPGTGREPEWWNNQPAKALHTGERGAIVNWKCCNDKEVTFNDWST